MSGYFFPKNVRPFSICSPTDSDGRQYSGLNVWLLQYVHPPVPFEPSRFGQVKPALMAIFCTLKSGKRSWRKSAKSRYGLCITDGWFC
jgi:hypothetical protein